ncbi:MAG: type II secretion system protein GspE [Zetaproteobacteria bacterium]|nr:MAG: type II secretion system protein GspE [Zetaproteobacteria bacterium]
MRRLARLTLEQVDSERVLRFPLHVLRAGPVLPLRPQAGMPNPVAVAEDASWPWALLDDCRRVLGNEVQALLVDREQLLTVLNQVFDMASASAEEMLEDLADDADDLAREIEEVGDLLEADDDAPVIRLVNTLISQALKDRASDIHIEPFEQRVKVRFRVDGILHTIVEPPKGVQAALTSRVKVMAGMDIAEKRQPQDGRFRVKIAGRDVDVRVSVLPTAHGERVVMRLLDKGARMLTLPELGMSKQQLSLLRRVIRAPHGIALVTGPTGSGKSTTLYAALMEVDRANRNVMTIEDPIEYQLEGVGQMQVQPKIGVDFAAGLRSILRQDPDIIMIGEIRDLETAEIAVQASLTGHLVMATLHTNDALSSIVRLRDMGVEPYLIASSLLLVQAQRLVRRLCPHCKRARPPRADEIDALEAGALAGVTQIFEPVGCARCMHTGFLGRIAIYEMSMISERMRDLIHAGEGLPGLRALAAKEGMRSLRADGARHVAEGITTIDEVLRVAREEAVVVEA